MMKFFRILLIFFLCFQFANIVFAEDSLDFLEKEKSHFNSLSINDAFQNKKYSKVVKLYENINVSDLEMETLANISILYSKSMSRMGDFKQAQKAILRLSDKSFNTNVTNEINRTSAFLKALKGDFSGAWDDYKKVEKYYSSLKNFSSKEKLKSLYVEIKEVYQNCLTPYYKRYILRKEGNLFKGSLASVDAMMKLAKDYLTDIGEDRFEVARAVIDDLLAFNYDYSIVKEAYLLKAETYYKQSDYRNADTWLNKYIEFNGSDKARALKMIEWIHRKELIINLNSNVIPNKKFRLTIQARNLPNVKIKVIKIDLYNKFEKNGTFSVDAFKNDIIENPENIKPILEQTVNLDCKSHDQCGKIIELGPYSSEQSGSYAIIVSGSKIRKAQYFIVADLAVTITKGDKDVLVFAADAISGTPVTQGKVIIGYDYSYDRSSQQYKFHKFAKGDLNEVGCFIKEFDNNSKINNLTAFVKSNNAVGVVQTGNINQIIDSKEKRFTFFIDKPVYRNNDTLKINVYARIFESSFFKAATTTKTSIEIYDPMDIKRADFDGVINENGIFGSEFFIDKNYTSGRYKVIVEVQGFGKKQKFFDVVKANIETCNYTSDLKLFNPSDKPILTKIALTDLQRRPLSGVSIEYILYKIKDESLSKDEFYYGMHKPMSLMFKTGITGEQCSDYKGEIEVLIPALQKNSKTRSSRYIFLVKSLIKDKYGKDIQCSERWPLLIVDNSLEVDISLNDSFVQSNSSIPFQISVKNHYQEFEKVDFKAILTKTVETGSNSKSHQINKSHKYSFLNPDEKFSFPVKNFEPGMWVFNIQLKGLWGETIECSKKIWVLNHQESEVSKENEKNIRNDNLAKKPFLKIFSEKTVASPENNFKIIINSSFREKDFFIILKENNIFFWRTVRTNELGLASFSLELPKFSMPFFTVEAVGYDNYNYYQDQMKIRVIPDPTTAKIRFELKDDNLLESSLSLNNVKNGIKFNVVSSENKKLNGQAEIIITNYYLPRVNKFIFLNSAYNFRKFKKLKKGNNPEIYIGKFFFTPQRSDTSFIFSENINKYELDFSDEKESFFDFNYDDQDLFFQALPLFKVRDIYNLQRVDVKNGIGNISFPPGFSASTYTDIVVRFSGGNCVGETKRIFSIKDIPEADISIPENLVETDEIESTLKFFIPAECISDIFSEKTSSFDVLLKFVSETLPQKSVPNLEIRISEMKLFTEKRDITPIDSSKNKEIKNGFSVNLSKSLRRSDYLFVMIPFSIKELRKGRYVLVTTLKYGNKIYNFNNQLKILPDRDIWSKSFPIKLNKGEGKTFIELPGKFFEGSEIDNMDFTVSSDPVISACMSLIENRQDDNNLSETFGRVLGMVSSLKIFDLPTQIDSIFPDFFKIVSTDITNIILNLEKNQFYKEMDSYLISDALSTLKCVVDAGGSLFNEKGILKGSKDITLAKVRSLLFKIKEYSEKNILSIDPRVHPDEILSLLSSFRCKSEVFNELSRVLLAQKEDLGIDGLSQLAVLCNDYGLIKERDNLLEMTKNIILKRDYLESHGNLVPANWFLFNMNSPKGGMPLILGKCLRALYLDEDYKFLSVKIISYLYNWLTYKGWNNQSNTGKIINIMTELLIYNKELLIDFNKLKIKMNCVDFSKNNFEVFSKEFDINKKLKLSNSRFSYSKIQSGSVQSGIILNNNSFENSLLKCGVTWNSKYDSWLFLNINGVFSNENSGLNNNVYRDNPFVPEWRPVYGVTMERKYTDEKSPVGLDINEFYKGKIYYETIDLNSKKVRGSFYLSIPRAASYRVIEEEFFYYDLKNENPQKIVLSKTHNSGNNDNRSIYLFNVLPGKYKFKRKICFDFSGKYTSMPVELLINTRSLCIAKSNKRKIIVK